ncbi:flagellar biosynthesis protein FlhA [Novosphingobium sp. B 225]|uniref:flagellar biosynthesis protein FlhA n=1 Tax=Novosphingobium sp. B 225 TaxID=1961849 RepID=UPI000B4AD1D1|nr:flagellar biosynthesis protein FlhA [Novosphingobium sp. B 225]
MLGRLIRNNSDLALVLGMVGILLVLFAPVPTALLDFLIILNFSFALTLLMMTFYVGKPVEFSTFPSLLLVATLFRLSLNVAATRLILTDGDAGQVIGSVGNFAAQGNYVIGLVVFFILIVVQYVVVTAGAQRVSEVAARFTLDAVPGQQMSIDADLNMGLIDQDEAKARRKNLERETAFYGAMDGASKFVKGDAVAGIVIVLINIIAGWIIGISQRGLDWSEALQHYTLLTIGDGIVTQVPALVISIATGIIVTRSAADRQLSTEVMIQLGSVPKIPLIVMGSLTLLLMLPGMPKWPIAILVLLFAAIWLSARRRRLDLAELPGQAEADSAQAAADRNGRVPAVIAIGLGSGLAEAWVSQRPVIAERIAALRQQHAEASGLTIPPIVVEDMAQVAPFDYQLLLHGSTYAKSTVHPDHMLAVRSSTSRDGLTGIETSDPAFGLPAWWIEESQSAKARELGYTLVDPITAMMTHLGEVVRSEAPLLLTRGDVTLMLDGVRQRQPGLVEELVPNVMSVSDVQRVLQNLLAEGVSIRSIDLICDILVDVGRTTRNHGELTELVRQRMSHIICNDLKAGEEQLSVLSLDPRIEAQIAEAVMRSPEGSSLVIEPKLADSLLRRVHPLVESMVQKGLSPVLLCGPAIRSHLRAFLRRSVPRLAVVSVNEVPQTIALKSFDVIRND